MAIWQYIYTLPVCHFKNMSKNVKRACQKVKIFSPKFQRWAKLFMDQENKEFYGNATKCALEVYNAKSYGSASSIGYQNFRKLQKVECFMLENKDLGVGRLLMVGVNKMLKGSYTDWENFMIRLGYFEKK